MAALEAALGSQVSPEFLRSQIEVGTGVPANSFKAARAELAGLRRTIAEARRRARARPDRRLDAPVRALEPAGADRSATATRRSPATSPASAGGSSSAACTCTSRIEDDELRIDLMNQARYFLPHLLMLSTSSPFCGGRGHRPQELPPRRLPGAAAHRAARPLRELGGIPAARSTCWCATASSRTPARSGGTCAHPRAFRPWRCASPTCARASRTPCAWRRMYV